jgi:signal transduction histidine kinase
MSTSRNSARRWAFVGALIIFVILLALAWPVDRWYRAQLLDDRRREAAIEVDLRASVLSSLLNRRFARLESLGSFVEAEAGAPDFSAKFERFAASLYEDARGVRNMALAPGGIITYIYPVIGNERTLGYRPLIDPRPEVRADAQRAIESGRITLTGPVDLIQGGVGLVAREAVTVNGEFWGFSNIALDLEAVLNEAELDNPDSELTFALRDSDGNVFFGDPEIFDAFPVMRQVDLPDGAWEVAAEPLSGWTATVQPALLLFRLGGLAVVLLLSSLGFLVINRQVRLQSAVAARTRELAEANILLETRVQTRTRELWTLLQVSRVLTSTLRLRLLLDLILEQLQSVVTYTAAAIYELETSAEGEEYLYLLQRQGPGDTAETMEPAAPQPWPLAVAGLHADVVRTQQPIVVPDVRADTPEASRWREGIASRDGQQPAHVVTWMCVPMLVKDRPLGLLTLSHHDPRQLSERDAELVQAFANQAALAIENARLYEQARSLAALQERQRLARELHDSVSQALYGIALGTRTAQTLAERGETAQIPEPLRYVSSLAEAALAEMRALIFELRPESLAEEGLVAALEKQAAALSARYEMPTRTDLCEEPDVPLAVKEALYRVGQEAMHNIVKHVHAGQVVVELRCERESLTLEIVDEGPGFDPNQIFPGHLGLRSMQERVERLGGTLTIQSAPGQGTAVRAQVPLP